VRKIQDYFDKNYKQLSDRDFKQVYQLSATQLYGVILRILRNRELAEECLQEVFVKIYHNFESYDSTKSAALTWMITIAKNHVISFLRKKDLDITDDFDLTIISDEQIALLQTLEDSEKKQQLNKCLKQLKSNIRQAVYLIYYYGKSYEELSINFNKPLNTVKSWVMRALPKLKKCLEKMYE
jgi:RNA polymerase sigma-70 factor (ECF subfamily)